MKKETPEQTAKRINALFKSAPKGTGEAIEKANYFGGKVEKPKEKSKKSK